MLTITKCRPSSERNAVWILDPWKLWRLKTVESKKVQQSLSGRYCLVPFQKYLGKARKGAAHSFTLTALFNTLVLQQLFCDTPAQHKLQDHLVCCMANGWVPSQNLNAGQNSTQVIPRLICSSSLITLDLRFSYNIFCSIPVLRPPYTVPIS